MLNNVVIKNVKWFSDHDGYRIAKGTVYYKGKRLGKWSMDEWGASDHYDFDASILDEEVEAYRNRDDVNPMYKKFFNTDMFMYRVLKAQ